MVGRVAVVGQGYVGLPVAQAAVAAGHTVVGFDVDPDRVEMLRGGRSPIEDVSDEDLRRMAASGRYRVSRAPDDLAGADVAVVTVPTPLRDHRPDLSAVVSAAATVGPRIRPGGLVVLESTVAPGTTTGEFTAALAASSGLVPGVDFLVGFSPERIDPGNPVWRFGNTPKLVAGTTPAALEAVGEFYATLCETVVRCPSPMVAELAKLLENTYRHVNIALVNEMGRHANQLGVSIWDVVAAARTKPYGFQAFYPGPGVGGHCLPVDPVYLAERVKVQLGRPFEFVDLAMQVNAAQPDYVVDRAVRILNQARKAVNGSRILLLGAAYKAGTGDVRETPARRVIQLLQTLGAEISVCDPYVDLGGVFPDVKVEQFAGVGAAAATADLTVLLTDHDTFPYREIAGAAPAVLDTRNRFAKAANIHHL